MVNFHACIIEKIKQPTPLQIKLRKSPNLKPITNLILSTLLKIYRINLNFF